MMKNKHQNTNEAPPLFSKWSSWYLIVLLLLVAEIILFYWISN